MSLYLTSTSDALSVVTGSAGTINVHASYADVSGTTVTTGRTNTAITTATTTTIVASPAASTTRNLKYCRISNDHATNSNAVTVRHTDGTTVVPLETITLSAGEALAFNGDSWRVIGSNGVERASTGATLTTGFAAGNPITANAADTYVGGFLVANRIQAGSQITWRMTVSKTAAGTAAPIFTFRSGTANAVGDTSRVALTSPFAQTGVTDTGTIIAFLTVRTHGSGTTGIVDAGYQLGHALAATGLGTQPSYGQAGTSTGFDTTAAGLYFGLSVNPGTAGVWTIVSSGVATNLIA